MTSHLQECDPYVDVNISNDAHATRHSKRDVTASSIASIGERSVHDDTAASNKLEQAVRYVIGPAFSKKCTKMRSQKVSHGLKLAIYTNTICLDNHHTETPM